MILKQDIEVIEAHLEQSSIIAQLCELYIYEGHEGCWCVDLRLKDN
ncbi:MAG TPA: hypothetical protein PK657_09740 [Legionella sp.]|nr:hypothetical protein [Legionella sp.]